jgi:hypothetical protein
VSATSGDFLGHLEGVVVAALLMLGTGDVEAVAAERSRVGRVSGCTRLAARRTSAGSPITFGR